MKQLSLFFAFLIITSCGGSDDAVTPIINPPTNQLDMATVDANVSDFMATYNIPGASLAISKNGKLVYVKGYGIANLTSGDAVTTAHRFRLASVSKTYTGIAIMKLIEEGQFTLDTKVFGVGGILANDYGTLPLNANLQNMTVKHLLQHTSGSWGAASGGDVIDQNPNYTYKQLFDWILDTRPNPNTPGTTYDYTNVGYSLLGRIIEKKSGKSYINYIKEDILAPIGVTGTDIAGKTLADQKPNEVTYYGQGNDSPFAYTIAFPRRDADGGLIATATDLLKLINATDGFATRPDILSQATITSFTTPSAANTGYANGIGIWSAENVWYNYGSLPGTRTGFMRHNNGMCVALLLNSRVDPSGNENPFVFDMQDLMLDLVKNSNYAWQNIDQF